MQELYLNIINNIKDGVYYVDLNREIKFWNKAAEDITGYGSEEMLGKKCQNSLLNHIDETGKPLCVTGCPLFSTIVDGRQRRARVFVRHKKGYRVPILTNIFPIEENGETIGAIEIFTQDSPVVYEDNLIEQLSDMAMLDALTGLPNRRYLESFINYKFDEFSRFGRPFAVLLADVDSFGSFNNTYGHEAGDEVLRNIAKSIKHNVRRADLIGRWGGEEILGVYAINHSDDAPLIGEKFRHIISNTELEHKSEVLKVSVSVGITTVRFGDTVETLIARADKYMYESKKSGKNRVTSD